MLVGAPLGVDITIICNVEASPKAINYWQRENGKFIVAEAVETIAFINLTSGAKFQSSESISTKTPDNIQSANKKPTEQII